MSEFKVNGYTYIFSRHFLQGGTSFATPFPSMDNIAVPSGVSLKGKNLLLQEQILSFKS